MVERSQKRRAKQNSSATSRVNNSLGAKDVFRAIINSRSLEVVRLLYLLLDLAVNFFVYSRQEARQAAELGLNQRLPYGKELNEHSLITNNRECCLQVAADLDEFSSVQQVTTDARPLK
jgi:hypothetical protein